MTTRQRNYGFAIRRDLLRGFHLNRGQFALLSLSIYIPLTLFLTWPLPLHLTSAVPNDIGDPLLNTWILAWDAHALLTRPLDLFNANIYYPLPNALAFSEHLLSTASLALPLQLAGGEPLLAYNLSLLLTFPLAAFGMYLLALRWAGPVPGRRGAAFLAGAIFAFAPYRFAAIAHLQLLTVQWLPFALLFLDRLLRPGSGRRDSAALAVFLTLQLLASWYLAIYTALVLLLYASIWVLARPRDWRSSLRALGPALAAGLLTLTLALPYLPLLADLRAARPPELAASFGAAPGDYLAAAPANTVYGPLTEALRARPGFTEENTLWAGVIPILLGLATLLPGKRPGLRTISLALWLVALISIALTFAGPYTFLIGLLPWASVVRVPPRWIIPALFALAGLSALGLSRLVARLRPHWRVGLLAALLAWTVAEAMSLPLPLARVGSLADLSPAYAWLAGQPGPFAVVELPLHAAPAPEFPEAKRLYASTRGWWGLVNGYSGFTPDRQKALAAELSGFPDEVALAALRRLAQQGVAYAIIHPDEAPLQRDRWQQSDRWRVERGTTLRPLADFGPELIYAINPHGGPPPPLDGSGRARATFDEGIALLGYHYETNTPDPRLTLYWWAEHPLPLDYTVFVHLLDASGQVLAQADGPPVSGHWPTRAWLPGEVVQDSRPLPPTPGPVAHLAIGLYDPATGQRLRAFNSAEARLDNDAVILTIAP